MAETLVGLISDTHGVFDDTVAAAFEGVCAIVHAGDVGHHGGVQAVLERLRAIAPVTAVRGNVDDDPEGAELPETAVLEVGGWRVLVTHILGVPPKVTPAGAAPVARQKADVAVCGHSHVFATADEGGVLYVNPGSAGPARFKLGRTVARLELPPKDSGRRPVVHRLELGPKAPPRLTAQPSRKRRRKD